VHLARSRALVLIGAVAATVSLSACADINGGGTDAPDAVKTLPGPIASSVKTDIGEYLVRPKAGVSSKDVQETMKQLRTMAGVQSAELTKDGVVDLQFLGGSTSKQREAAVKQLAALGDVYEGV
jgi:hypothetical protein